MRSLLILFFQLILLSSSFAVTPNELKQLIKNSDLVSIKKISKENLSIGLRDKLGRNALQMSVLYKKNHIAFYLIENGIGIETPDYLGRTALMMSVINSKNIAVIKKLIKAKASPFPKDKNGRGVIYYAGKSGDKSIIALVKRYIKSFGIGEEIPTEAIAALYRYVEKYNLAGIKSFFNRYKRLDVSLDGRGKISDIILGPSYIERLTLRELLKFGLNINHKDANGQTPLIRAIRAKNTSAISQLLDAKGRSDITDDSGRDGLMLTLKVQLDDNLIARIAERNLVYDQRDKDGNTVLHYAIRFGTAKQVNMMIELGTPLDIPNNLGVTPALLAAKKSKGEIVGELIKRECSIDVTDEDGKDVMMILAEKSPKFFIAIRSVAKKRNYNFYKKDLSGKSANEHYMVSRSAITDEVNLKDIGIEAMPSFNTDHIYSSVEPSFVPYDADIADISVTFDRARSNVFLGHLEEKIFWMIEDQKQKYIQNGKQKILGAELPFSENSRHGSVNFLIKSKQQELKQTRLEFSGQLIKMHNYRRELDELTHKRVGISSKSHALYETYVENKRRYLEHVTKLSNELRQVTEKKEKLSKEVELFKNGKNDASLEEKYLLGQLDDLDQRKDRNISEVDERFKQLSNNAKDDLDVEIKSFAELDARIKKLKDEKNGIEKKIETLKKEKNRNINFIKTEEHQKIHIKDEKKNWKKCPYLRRNRKIDKELIPALRKRLREIKKDLKSLVPRKERKKEILEEARTYYRQKVKEYAQDREASKNLVLTEYNIEIEDINRRLVIVRDQQSYIKEILAQEVADLNSEIRERYGDPIDAERVWNNIIEFTSNFSRSVDDSDFLPCYGLFGPSFYCELKDGFHNKRSEYQIADVFLSEYESLADEVSKSYLKFSTINSELSFINYQITVRNSKIQSLELQKEQIRLLEKELFDLKKQVRGDTFQVEVNEDLAQFIRVATMQANKLKKQFIEGAVNFDLEKNSELGPYQSILKKLGLKSFEDFILSNLEANVFSPSSNLSFDILDPWAIHKQQQLSKDSKKRFFSGFYQVLSSNNYLEEDIWSTKIGKILSVNSLLSMAEAIKVQNEESTGYAIVTSFGQYLISANGDLIEYDLSDDTSVDLINLANDIENSLREAKPQTSVGKKAKLIGLATIDLAKIELKSGNKDEADLLLAMSKDMLEIAMDITPGISLGKDTYEALTGTSIITGKPLETFDRTFAFLGIFSFGMLKHLKYPSKTALNVLMKIKGIEKGTEFISKGFDKAIDWSQKIYRSARKLGLRTTLNIKKNIGILQRWEPSFAKTKIDDALDINSELAKIGYSKPPYTSGSKVVTFKPTKPTDFVRVHGTNNKGGRWVMNKADIEGLSPVQIKDKYALPEVPTFVSDTKIPSGTSMRIGEVAPNYGSKGGGTQLEVLERVEFTNTRPIGDL